jgi:hypothetical protein
MDRDAFWTMALVQQPGFIHDPFQQQHANCEQALYGNYVCPHGGHAVNNHDAEYRARRKRALVRMHYQHQRIALQRRAVA